MSLSFVQHQICLQKIMDTNLFQNAKILEKIIAQSPHAGFHPIFSQDPKDFRAGTSVEG